MEVFTDDFDDLDIQIDYTKLHNLYLSRTDALSVICDDATCICNIHSYHDLLYYNLPVYNIQVEYLIHYNPYECIKVLKEVANKLNPKIGNSYYLILQTLAKHSNEFKAAVELAYITEYVDINYICDESDFDFYGEFMFNQYKVFNKLLDIIYIINIKSACKQYNKKTIGQSKLFQCKSNPYNIILLDNTYSFPQLLSFFKDRTFVSPFTKFLYNILNTENVFEIFYIQFQLYNKNDVESYLNYVWDQYSIFGNSLKKYHDFIINRFVI